MGDLSLAWSMAIGLIGILGAPLLAFWAARRTSSGRIATSDATDLWNESQKIRDFLNHQVTGLRAELTKVTEEARSEIVRLEGLLVEKEIEIVKLSMMIVERDARVSRLERLLGPKAV